MGVCVCGTYDLHGLKIALHHLIYLAGSCFGRVKHVAKSVHLRMHQSNSNWISLELLTFLIANKHTEKMFDSEALESRPQKYGDNIFGG